MRIALLVATLLVPVACAATPAADAPSAPVADAPAPGAETADAANRCPAADAPCMNAENHAQCQQLAASCDGEILQLESCPLQFSCAES